MGISQATVSKHVVRMKARLQGQGILCACGKPIGHMYGCIKLTDEERALSRQRAYIAKLAWKRRRREAERRWSEAVVSPRATAARVDALYATIAAKVPRHLPEALRDDIISDAYLALLEKAA